MSCSSGAALLCRARTQRVKGTRKRLQVVKAELQEKGSVPNPGVTLALHIVRGDNGLGKCLLPTQSPVLEACSLLVLFCCTPFIWRAENPPGVKQTLKGLSAEVHQGTCGRSDKSPHLIHHCTGKCHLRIARTQSLC